MSLITKQVEKLRYMADDTTQAKFRKVLHEAADTIEELSTKLAATNTERSTAYYRNGWIPCTEKLPTDGLVYELSCKYLDQDYVTIGYCKSGKPVYSYTDDNSVFKRSEVVAWREFGEPYKEA